MRIAKSDVPEQINVPGAVARQAFDFGDAGGYGAMAGEYFSFGEGTDIAELLKGLDGDMCQSPHWGFMLDGEVTVTYHDGQMEVVRGNDLFYWPPGHSVRAEKASEIILFSPQAEHCEVVDHIKRQVAG